MNAKFLYTLFLALLAMKAFSQEAVVSFTGDKACEVLLYEPIDGEYQEKIPSKRSILQAGREVSLRVSVPTYTFVYCEFPQYERSCSLPLFPGDSIHIDLSGEGLTFRGSNHAGLQYYYDHFQNGSRSGEYLKMQRLFLEYTDGDRELQTLRPVVEDSLQVSVHLAMLDTLALHKEVTPAFAQLLQKEIYMMVNADFVSWFRISMSRKRKNLSLTTGDSLKLTGMIDRVYEQLPISPELQRHPSLLYTLNYYSHYHGGQCPDGFDAETFGPYSSYLFAPVEMQPGLLGGACLVQLKYNSGEMNLQKLKAFFREKFPQAAYTAIISERVKDEPEDEGAANRRFIEKEIHNLAELSYLPELKGQYLFIDLWASWCMPCRTEFSYQEQLHRLLAARKNIQVVYISIDRENQAKAWLENIKFYKLSGFHLRASKELTQHLEEAVYAPEKITIPRYLLLSPSGEILHKDLPHPGNYANLEKELDRILGQQ